MEVEIAKPALVEPGIKYFLNETLSNCAKFKKKYYNDMLNIGDPGKQYKANIYQTHAPRYIPYV